MTTRKTTGKKVIVIGGGAIGLCAAWYLNASGCDVTLLEKSDIGSGSSLHNAGLVVPSHFVPLAAPGMVAMGLRWMANPDSPFYIKPRLDLDLLAWLWRFAAASTQRRVQKAMPLLRDLSYASLALFVELAKSGGSDFQFRREGLVILFRTEHGKKGSLGTAELASKIGVNVVVLNRTELHDLEPDVRFNATGGVYYPEDAHLTPAIFLEWLRSRLQSNNVRIVTSTEVKGFETRSARISEVTTTNGSFAGDEFVLAGGAWSPGILRGLNLRLSVQAGKGYSVTLRKSIRPRMPFILEEARIAITPMGEDLRIAGTMELAGLDTSITRRRVDAMLRAVPLYLADVHPSDAQNAGLWGGLRPCSPDGLPFIGRFRRYENLIAATGHAMLGISLGPITGKLVAEIVGGQVPSFELGLLSPDRYA